MSESSDEEDPIDNIDFSVISTAIEAGGNTLDQILNAVHYGSPEVRQLLRESCDYIFECKHCKSLFRSIPNFVAHKRIYCGDKSFFQNVPKKKQKKREEVVVVRPVSPSLSVPVEIPKEGDKTVLEQILTGTFEGNSDAYKHYTDVATNVEKQKLNPPSTVIITSSIKNTQKAVNVAIVERPSDLDKSVASNASSVIAKAKKSHKPPLTKIVDGLKKTAKTTNLNVTSSKKPSDKPSKSIEVTPKKVAEISPKEDGESRRKTKEKKSNDGNENPKKSGMATQTPVAPSPKKVTQTKVDSADKKPKKEEDKKTNDAKLQDKILSSSEQAGNRSNDSSIKSAKVVLVQLQDNEITNKSKDGLTHKLEGTTYAYALKTGKNMDKPPLSKPVISQLRPVKTQDGSELSELSQLGHCDLLSLKCLICNLEYSQKKTLLQHMHVIHSGTKKKYPCNICTKTFDYFWGLTRHLILNHKKSKEQVESMRAELRALAYTVNESDQHKKSSSAENANDSNVNDSTGKSTRRQIHKTVVSMHTCLGCEKSFWKKSNFEKHLEQCSFYARLPSTVMTQGKSKESQENKDLEDSKKKEESASENHRSLGSERARKRYRTVLGRFVSNDEAVRLIDTKAASEAQSKSRLAKKLKEKSCAYVPPKRFINTRRSTAFYHSPAQRTRFHDQRRAVVDSPKRDSRSQSKSPKKSTDASKSGPIQLPDTSPDRQKLEIARRSLQQALEKGTKKDSDSGSEKEPSPIKTRSKLSSGKELDKKLESDTEKTAEKSSGSDSGTRRSRSTTRGFKTPSRDSSVESKRSNQKDDKYMPSRDSSGDSIKSRQSTRSNTGASTERTRCRTKSSEILKLHSKQKDLSESNRESVSRDTSAESSRSSPRNQSRNRAESASVERPSHHSVRRVSQSRDSSTDSIRTRSSDVTELKSSSMMAPADPKTPKILPSPSVDGSSETSPSNKTTSQSGKKNSKCSPGKDEIDGGKSNEREKSKPKWSSKDYSTRSTGTPRETRKAASVKKGKDESRQVPKTVIIESGKIGGKKDKIDESERKNAQKIETLKGVSKPKIAKCKARYSTRSLKAKVQAAKKVGELKKRYITRISEKKLKEDSGNDSNEKPPENKNQKNVLGKTLVGRKAVSTTTQAAIQIIVSPTLISTETNTGIVTKLSPASNTAGKNEASCQTRKGYRGNDTTNTSTDSKMLTTSKQTVNEKARKISGNMEIQKQNLGKDVTLKSPVIPAAVTYQHRRRMPSEGEGIKVIEEIWVSKMPGQPLQSIKHKKTIIDSPKKTKAGRMYVVDSTDTDGDKAKCLDFSRINHLVDYKNNKCLQCGVDFTDISSLRRHAVRHLGWKRYKCKLCAYTGFNKSECNSHIKRRHAEKLLTSGSPLSTFIVDLNKEASNIRNKKKKSTIQKKNSAKVKPETKPKAAAPARRTSLRQSRGESAIVLDESEDKTAKEVKDGDSELEVRPINAGPSNKNICKEQLNQSTAVPDTNSSTEAPAKDDKLCRKRKRTGSEEGLTASKESEPTSKPFGDKMLSMAQSEAMSEQGADNFDDFDEEIGSVSDYDNDDGDAPQRNVVSPTWVKMNPNVALMMATLEEARATKFSRGKRGRGGMRRLSSPLNKQARLSTDEGLNSSKEEEEVGQEGNQSIDQPVDEKAGKDEQSLEITSIESDSETCKQANIDTEVKVQNTGQCQSIIGEHGNDESVNEKSDEKGEEVNPGLQSISASDMSEVVKTEKDCSSITDIDCSENTVKDCSENILKDCSENILKDCSDNIVKDCSEETANDCCKDSKTVDTGSSNSIDRSTSKEDKTDMKILQSEKDVSEIGDEDVN